MSQKHDPSQPRAPLSPSRQALLEKRLQAGLTATRKEHAIARRLEQGPVSLSFAQQRLWFLDQWEPDRPWYNIPRILWLDGSLNIAALQHSLAELTKRHETLRTTFIVVNEVPLQNVNSTRPVPLPIVDLRARTADEQQAEVCRLSAAEARRPFDLAHGPLLRTTLLQLDRRYALLVTLHHIISDGWSMRVLLQEWGALYSAFVKGEDSPLPELPIQYADFALWQRAQLQGEVLDKQLAYWKQQLRGDLPVLQLPIDHLRPAVQTFEGAIQSFRLSPDVTIALKALSQQEGATLFMALIAAFDVLLYRYTGQTDILVGSPVANRTRSEVEGLIGFFVNTLVLRADLSDNPTFRELLKQIRHTALEAFAHQDIPFEKLVEELAPERTLSHTPLFQVLFSFQNEATDTLQVSALGLTAIEVVDKEVSNFDLTLSLEETAQEELVGAWQYNTDLFDGATIKRMIEHYTTLLKAMVQQPETHISRVDLLSAAERHRVLVGWNATTRPYPREHSLWDLLQAQAAQRPDAVALVCGGNTLTYRALVTQARQVATQLRTAGVGPEVLVGVCLERSLEWLVSVVGIVAAGGAYVPMDPHNPPERLAFLAHDLTQAQGGHRPLVLTTADLAQRLPLDAVKVMLTEAILSSPTEAGQEFAMSAWPDTLAYVMYTSGSTGQPKGSAVSQRNVVRLVKEQTYARLGPDEIFLQAAPVAFDASTLEIWGCLLNGSRLVILPGGAPTLAELGQVLEQEQVSVLWLTAGLFHQMVDEQLTSLGHVRQLLAGGDVLSPEHVRRVLTTQPQTVMINGYGPTECTTFTTCYPMHAPDQVGESVSIGQPLANTQVYILDREMQPVPIGVPGELYVGGDGLSRGYLNRPDLTAQAFVPNPFGEAGVRLYKTGDLVRYRADGRIEFLGRRDQQVKLRGFRIELGEIETVLQQHPAIRQAVVLLRERTLQDSSEKQLVGYLVFHEQQAIDVHGLRDYLAEHLPDYMVPAAWVVLDSFPLTSNGKIDRRALPEPEFSSSEQTAANAPGTPTELLVAEIWQQVFGVDYIGKDENFFELGGHSLLATRVMSRMRQVFNVDLPLRTLFESPSVAGLAHVIDETLHTGASTGAIAFSLEESEDTEIEEETL